MEMSHEVVRHDDHDVLVVHFSGEIAAGSEGNDDAAVGSKYITGHLTEKGTPIPTIAAPAGHESIRTTMRYACHLPEGATVEAIWRLDSSSKQMKSGSSGYQQVPM